jgi:hypothetical protein
MRVIHGVWALAALCLWGEDPDRPAAPRDPAPAPAPHPFACQAAELDAWLASARIPAGPVRTCFRLTEPAGEQPQPSEGCLACW